MTIKATRIQPEICVLLFLNVQIFNITGFVAFCALSCCMLARQGVTGKGMVKLTDIQSYKTEVFTVMFTVTAETTFPLHLSGGMISFLG